MREHARFSRVGSNDSVSCFHCKCIQRLCPMSWLHTQQEAS